MPNTADTAGSTTLQYSLACTQPRSLFFHTPKGGNRPPPPPPRKRALASTVSRREGLLACLSGVWGCWDGPYTTPARERYASVRIWCETTVYKRVSKAPYSCFLCLHVQHVPGLADHACVCVRLPWVFHYEPTTEQDHHATYKLFAGIPLTGRTHNLRSPTRFVDVCCWQCGSPGEGNSWVRRSLFLSRQGQGERCYLLTLSLHFTSLRRGRVHRSWTRA